MWGGDTAWDELVAQTAGAVERAREAREQLSAVLAETEWKSNAGALFLGQAEYLQGECARILDEAEQAHAAALTGRQRAAEQQVYPLPHPNGVEHIGGRMGWL
ncbi:hypothetical protein GCM10027591_05460 [Zhihengliuella somnathii]